MCFCKSLPTFRQKILPPSSGWHVSLSSHRSRLHIITFLIMLLSPMFWYVIFRKSIYFVIYLNVHTVSQTRTSTSGIFTAANTSYLISQICIFFATFFRNSINLFFHQCESLVSLRLEITSSMNGPALDDKKHCRLLRRTVLSFSGSSCKTVYEIWLLTQQRLPLSEKREAELPVIDTMMSEEGNPRNWRFLRMKLKSQ